MDALMSHPLKPHSKILNILKQMSPALVDIEKFEKANVVHRLLGALRNFCIARKLATFLQFLVFI